MLAALPAEVRISPSSTYSTDGSTVTAGWAAAKASLSAQWVAGAQRDDPSATLVRLAEGGQHATRHRRGVRARRDDDGTRSRECIESPRDLD